MVPHLPHSLLCFCLLKYATLTNFFPAFTRMLKSKIGKQLHEEPKLQAGIFLQFSSDSIWFINLTNSLEYKRPRCGVPNQLPGAGPTLGAHHGAL